MTKEDKEKHKQAQEMRDDVPSTVARSDDKAVRTYKKTLQSAEESYGDGERAHRTAYASLKHTHEKVGDHWEPKEHKGPSDPQAAQGAPRSLGQPRSTAQGVDANASPAHLKDVARRLDREGQRTRDETLTGKGPPRSPTVAGLLEAVLTSLLVDGRHFLAVQGETRATTHLAARISACQKVTPDPVIRPAWHRRVAPRAVAGWRDEAGSASGDRFARRTRRHELGAHEWDVVVSTHEIFAAFVVNRAGAGGEPAQTPLEWVGDRAGRAGLAPKVAAPDPAGQGAECLPYRDALPYMEGDWLGMPVELRFIEGEDYRALVVVVGHAAFMRRVVRSADAFLEGVVSAFREACDAIAPTYAYLVTAPEDDIPGRLKRVSVDLRDLDPCALTGLGLPLAYLDGALAATPFSGTPASGNPAGPASGEREPRPALRVPARSGVVLVDGDSLTGWL